MCTTFFEVIFAAFRQFLLSFHYFVLVQKFSCIFSQEGERPERAEARA